jgi:outer membrane receptor protein involved in Fe transport
MRYAMNENKTVLRLSGGKALRTATLFAENMNFMASSRQWLIQAENYLLPYGLKPEEATNFGLNFTHKFQIDYRDAYVTLDVYRTDFKNQIVVDIDESPQQVLISNLKGVSFSNTLQFEMAWEVRKRLQAKCAYRYVDTKMSFTQGILEKAFISKHRSFINFSYESKNEHWLWDWTTQWHGAKRLPSTASNPIEYRVQEKSPDYFLSNAQVTYTTKKKWQFDFYIGVENVFNFKQKNVILAGDQPFGNYFDASIVWAPIFGRMMYGGLRIKLK